MKFTQNGPDVPPATEQLVRTAHARWVELGKPHGKAKPERGADLDIFS